MSDEKYLAVKNWRLYQSIDDDFGSAPWIKDYVGKDIDRDRMKLTVFQAGVLDRLYRLRARYAHILHNDITWLTQATHMKHRDAAHMAHTVGTLIIHNFIIPTNDENFETLAAVDVEVKKRRGKKEQRKAEVEDAATDSAPEMIDLTEEES